MGMFDEVRCLYPLPELPDREKWNWQSKDTPAQDLDTYEIRKDGTLWHEAYDWEKQRVKEQPKGSLAARFTIDPGWAWRRVNKHWLQVTDVDGELEIHDYVSDGPPQPGGYSVRFWFRDGKVKDCTVQQPTAAADEG